MRLIIFSWLKATKCRRSIRTSPAKHKRQQQPTSTLPHDVSIITHFSETECSVLRLNFWYLEAIQDNIALHLANRIEPERVCQSCYLRAMNCRMDINQRARPGNNSSIPFAMNSTATAVNINPIILLATLIPVVPSHFEMGIERRNVSQIENAAIMLLPIRNDQSNRPCASWE